MKSELEQFAARNSADGLFLRFAAARAQGFLMRQTMMAAGAVSIGVLASAPLGVLTATLAVTGDLLDSLLLYAMSRRYRYGHVPTVAIRFAAMSGLLQAVSISACVMIAWRWIEVEAAQFFAATFLMSATINAGLMRRHFPLAAHLRLGVYTSAGLALLLSDIVENRQINSVQHWFFLISVLILGYTTVLFIRAIERNSSERHRFQTALMQESEALQAAIARANETAQQAERLALVARHASDSVIFSRQDGRIEWVNEAFTRITGYSFDQAVGQYPGDLLNSEQTEPVALDVLLKAHQNAVPARVEIQNRTCDGRIIWMEVSLNPVFGSDGNPDVFIAVERDVTLAKIHEAELAQAKLSAECAARAKSQFLATMSHEIRTPMNGVIGIAELLEETPLDQGQKHYVSTIIDSGRALLAIINDVLDLSKLQAGKADLLDEPFLIAECVRGAVDLLRPTAMKKGLALSVEVSDDEARHLGDPGRLRQILLNLLGNALKFTSKGEVKLTVATKTEANLDTIRISVTDTGIGIAADRIGFVFDSFAQADSTISRAFGGTGLGLTISRLLAQQMGGDIEVVSEIGKGSVFTVILRLNRATQRAPISKDGTVPPRTQLKLLVAEDNRTNMLITRKMLERSVESIDEAYNGKQAVAAYWRAQPDLVLMDVSMPEMTGHDAAREIRRFEIESGLQRCPIFALTAYASSDEEALCLAAGMDGVLTKPLVRAELHLLLTRIENARVGFDLSAENAVKKEAKGDLSWSTSRHASGTISGRSTQSFAR